MLFLDGVYAGDKYGVMRFHRAKAPTIKELNTLAHQISHRVTRFLEKKGWLQRDELERLCRYISRPAVSEKRLALTSNGKVRYELKTPYRDGTHVFFDRGGLPSQDFGVEVQLGSSCPGFL